MATPEEIAAANEDGDFKAKMTRMYNEWELAKSNLLDIVLMLPGTLEFGGGVGRLWKEGASFLAEDSGDALAAIPTGAGLNWFKDKFVGGTPIGELAGGYSTPAATTIHHMAMRVFPAADGATAKVGIWDVDDWNAALTIQQTTPTNVAMAFFRTTAAQTAQNSFFTLSGDPTGTEFTAYILAHGQLRLMQVQPLITVKTAAYTAVRNDFVVAEGTFTVTLPDGAIGAGVITVKNAGTGTITVAVLGGSGDTIFEFVSGLTSITLSPGEARSFLNYIPVSDGVWMVF